MIAAAAKAWPGGVGASLHHHCCCSCCCSTALYDQPDVPDCECVLARLCVWLTLSGTSVNTLPLQCNSSTHNDCGTCQRMGFGAGMRRVLATIHHGGAMLVGFCQRRWKGSHACSMHMQLHMHALVHCILLALS